MVNIVGFDLLFPNRSIPTNIDANAAPIVTRKLDAPEYDPDISAMLSSLLGLPRFSAASSIKAADIGGPNKLKTYMEPKIVP